MTIPSLMLVMIVAGASAPSAAPCVRASPVDTLAADDTVPFALPQLRIPGAQEYCTVRRDPRTGRKMLHFGLRGTLDGAAFDILGSDSTRIAATVLIPRASQIKPQPGRTLPDFWQLQCETRRAGSAGLSDRSGISCDLELGELHLTRSVRGLSVQLMRPGDPLLGATERADFQSAMSSFDQNRFIGARADSALVQLRAGSAVEITLGVPAGENVKMSLLSLKNFSAAYDLMEKILGAFPTP